MHSPISGFGRTTARSLRALLGCVAVFALAACGKTANPTAASGAPAPVQIVTSATMVTDMVKAIGGERVAVDGLMGPGIDPHLFRPSVSDIRRLRRADGVFYLGLRFEELMQDVLQQRAEAGQKVFALADAIPREKLIVASETSGIYDPHVWFDVSTWTHCIDAVLAGLTELDPDSREYFAKNAADYRRRLEELHRWALDKTAEIPVEQRVLVTSHDAYNYFGRAYGFEVVGLMGISTASEAGLSDITQLADFIRQREIPAIFVESSVSPRALERVSSDSGAVIGGELFSDALGAPGDIRDGFDTGTYEGMIRYNISTIVHSLQPKS